MVKITESALVSRICVGLKCFGVCTLMYATKMNHSSTWGYWIKVTEKLVVVTQESQPWQAKLSWSKWWVRRLLRDEKCIWQFWVIVEQWLSVQSREVCGCGLPGPWSERFQWNGSYPKLWGDNILISHLLLFVCPSAHMGHRLGLTQLLFQGGQTQKW